MWHLGPTLFILYINAGFESVNNHVKMMIFADDCVLFKSHKNSYIALDNLQKGLDEYVEWGTANNMHQNVSKSKVMLISPSLDYNLYRPLFAGVEKIHYVRKFNYLGVIFYDQLNFNAYYHSVTRKVENKIFVLSKIKKMWIITQHY